MTTKITLNNIADTALATLTGPKVTTIVYPGTETATDVVGGATINLTGSGFQSGCSVLVASTASSVVTFISSTQISFIAPALNAGTYVIYVINPDGGTAISIPGISYSGTPNWTTAAGSLGTAYETGAISTTLTATGDAPITYTLASGTLPTGSTLASNGTLSGTAQATASATTYTFAVTARDAQNQTTNRSFSLTINTDVVTWSSPADSTTYTVNKDSAIANVTMSATSAAGGSITYTADTLPTGLSITGANIAGTPTVAANTSTTLTATSTATRIATKIINWSITVANDPYFGYNTLLIPGASTTFVDDASINNFAVSIFGDTKPNNFNPYTSGYYSNYFDGAGDYLTAPNNAAFNFGTGNFTMEAWVYANNLSNNPFLMHKSTGNGTNAGWFFELGAGLAYFGPGVSNNTYAIFTSDAISTNNWFHIAVTRVSTTLQCFVNGTSIGTSTLGGYGGNKDNAAVFEIAAWSVTSSAYDLNGYVSNLRVVKGTAVYTVNFTPSATPLTAIANTSLLTCQSNRFIDNSTNNFTITVNGNTSISSFDPFVPNTSYSTYGSGYFDGTGDYLQVANNVSNQMGSGDWTAETWIYITSYSSLNPVIAKGGSTTDWFLATASANGRLYFGIGATDYFSNTGPIVPLNTWNHVALVRSGTTLNTYLNGVLGNTQSGIAQTFASTGALNIGRGRDTSSNYLTGYISDTRLVKGTAVYTTTFTPPSAPLTAIANTSLLTLQNNQSVNNSVFLDNSTNNFFVTRNGNTTQGTFSPYGSNWSNYFDGAGDSLTGNMSQLINFGTNDFTVEFWINFSNTAAQTFYIFDGRDASTPSAWALYRSAGGDLSWYNGSSNYAVSSFTNTGVWTHVAWSRSGTSLRAFINGALTNTFTDTTSYASLPATSTIGSRFNGVEYINGYISNLRVIKGTGLYTYNFTPSTTPLTAITNTSLLTCQSNRFIDNSTNNITITKLGNTSIQRFSPFSPTATYSTSTIGGSGYFDGSSNYLTVPSNSAFVFGLGNFTMEAWIYHIGNAPNGGVTTDRFLFGGFSTSPACVFFLTNNALNLALWDGTTQWTSAGSVTPDTWAHIAFSRVGTSLYLAINGVVQMFSGFSTNFTVSRVNYIGRNDTTTDRYFPGYISNLRVIKGTGLYTSNFTPSTTPLTAITNTSLLLNYTNAGIIDNTMLNNLETVGNAQISTAQTKFGGGSMSFDGTGDYLVIPATPNLIFNRSFTIEFWINFTATPSNFIGLMAGTTANTQLFITTKVNGQGLRFGLTGVAEYAAGTQSWTTGTWYHVALVRNITGVKFYVNGTDVTDSTYTNSTSYSGVLQIGGNISGTAELNGYMDDFRITKGYARYTSNFTPPTAAFNGR